ncbi:hypothetical protein JHL18_00630 [Clostridium sp. YIM B02505]|uniref:Uncharacterized protein n=1 Tax=Clostridium yunnanense TaxID=2800325 RepID=A0ABS1EIG4_9CLOT|nr:hypothetical protein [Clostridium yunnanense]MBK1809153.1 hypothetical protein [Clostridium yunnanense]
MNNRENLRQQIELFLRNENEKIMFISGTHQNEKHREVLRVINSFLDKGVKVLFRANAIDNINEFIDNNDVDIKTKKLYKSGNLNMYFDSINKASWETGARYNISILYPVDSICRKNDNTRREIINDLIRKTVHKIFLVTWTDNVDYTWLNEFTIDRKVVFDAEEEDMAYHNRVINIINKQF